MFTLTMNTLRCRCATEHKFHPTRDWRFDYAWPEVKVAVEKEGGAFTGGRHTRGAGFVEDMAKYNAAVMLGWKLLRYTPQQLLKKAPEIVGFIQSLQERQA